MLQVVFLVAGVAFVGLSLGGLRDEMAHVVWPRPASLAVSGLLLAVSQLTLLPAWTTLLGVPMGEPGVARGLYSSQLGKYVPGVIWQPAGQIALARGSTGTLGASAVSYLIYLAVAISASLTIGASYSFLGGSVVWSLRLVSLAGLGSLALLNRRWVLWATTRAPVPDRLRQNLEKLPSQKSIWSAFIFSVIGFVAQGAAFGSLYTSMVDGGRFFEALVAYPLAWAAGFLAVLVPSGVGIREGLLVLLLGTSGGAAGVVAASVMFRVLAICVDTLAAIGSRIFGSAEGPQAEGN